MSLPDEYDSWRCEECPDHVEHCKADWCVCDMCVEGIQVDGSECDDCSGCGGGHVCIYDTEN